jgi:hypothetical protein
MKTKPKWMSKEARNIWIGASGILALGIFLYTPAIYIAVFFYGCATIMTLVDGRFHNANT